MPAEAAVVPLAPGLWRDGALHADAAVRPLTGEDEALLSDLGGGRTVAERVTALLATAVRRIGAIAPIGPDDVRELRVGDRERLLLALHRHTFGPRLDAVARCPAAGCATVMDIPLDLDDLLVTDRATPATPIHALEVEVGGRRLRVRVRLPDGGDQEAAARVAAVDPSAAAAAILRRTVLAVDDGTGGAVAIDDVLADLHPVLAAELLRLDPQSETSLVTTCPDCGTRSTLLFDVTTFLLGALAGWDSLLTDVHRIALRYHWGEAEILALPIARRRRYLALLDEPPMAQA